MTTVILNLDTVNLSDEQFYQLCQVNQDWQQTLLNSLQKLRIHNS